MERNSRDDMDIAGALGAVSPVEDRIVPENGSNIQTLRNQHDRRSSGRRHREQRRKVETTMYRIPNADKILDRETLFMYRAGRVAERFIPARSGCRTRLRTKLVLLLWIFWGSNPCYLEKKWWELKEDEILPPFMEYWESGGHGSLGNLMRRMTSMAFRPQCQFPAEE